MKIIFSCLQNKETKQKELQFQSFHFMKVHFIFITLLRFAKMIINFDFEFIIIVIHQVFKNINIHRYKYILLHFIFLHFIKHYFGIKLPEEYLLIMINLLLLEFEFNFKFKLIILKFILMLNLVDIYMVNFVKMG